MTRDRAYSTTFARSAAVSSPPHAPDAGAEGDLAALARCLEPAAVILRNGKVAWANPAAAKLVGVGNPQELHGSSLDSLIEVADRSHRLERLWIAPTRDSADGQDGLGHGEELWVIRERSHGGHEDAHRGDELAEARRELACVREDLAREQLEREYLLSVVSHELRTPITVIRGYNNLLLTDDVGKLNAQQQSFILESNRSCERLNRFVGDLLSACGEPGAALAVERKEASLEPLVAGVVAFFRPLLEERGVKLAVDLAPDALRAEFDAVRIEQVITNLLTNAIRYSKSGTTVRIESRRVAQRPREEIEVSVVDTGPGVAPEDRERVFEPYVRVGCERGASGLGLGLAICRRIVEAHSGTIRVEDEKGAGSRFVFKLPIRADVE